MTQSNKLIKCLENGDTLRFYDYGSNENREVYCQVGKFEKEQFVISRCFSPQTFYKVRKNGTIIPSGMDNLHDYYKLNN